MPLVSVGSQLPIRERKDSVIETRRFSKPGKSGDNQLEQVEPHQNFTGRHRWDPDALWSAEEDARVVRKTDLHLLLCFCAMNVGLAIDRHNLANALTDDFLGDLGLTTTDYNNGGTATMLALLLSEFPTQMLIVRYGFRNIFPWIIMAWGTVCESHLSQPQSSADTSSVVTGLCTRPYRLLHHQSPHRRARRRLHARRSPFLLAILQEQRARAAFGDHDRHVRCKTGLRTTMEVSWLTLPGFARVGIASCSRGPPNEGRRRQAGLVVALLDRGRDSVLHRAPRKSSASCNARVLLRSDDSARAFFIYRSRRPKRRAYSGADRGTRLKKKRS